MFVRFVECLPCRTRFVGVIDFTGVCFVDSLDREVVQIRMGALCRVFLI